MNINTKKIRVDRQIKKENLSPSQLKMVLDLICDDDFIGLGNTENYIKVDYDSFKEIEENCYGNYTYFTLENEYKVAPIDYRWNETTKGYTEEEIVEYAALIVQDMIHNNYRKDSRYHNVKSYVIDDENFILVKVECEMDFTN